MRGVNAEGSEEHKATVTVGDSIYVKNPPGFATCITSKGNALVTVGKDISSEADDAAIGIENRNGGTVKVTGNVSANSESHARGVVSFCKNDVTTTNNIQGDITTNGIEATGAALVTGKDSNAKLLLSVGGNITSAAIEEDEYRPFNKSIGIGVYTAGGTIDVDIAGNITTKSNNADATGIKFGECVYDDEENDNIYPGENNISVHGNIVSNGVGIHQQYVYGLKCTNNVLVENEINADKVGVLIEKTPFVPVSDDGEIVSPQSTLNLTVWKIKLNEYGNAAEYDIDKNNFPDGIVPEGVVTHGQDTEFEKKIMYIIKVEQPGEGGTLKATDANGNALAKSFDFDVAHEGDKVLLKANLKEGYKIVAAYNGLGEKEPLLVDENGNYYIIVPKGGGVYLSVELEDTTEHSQADNDDDIESLIDDDEKSATDKDDEINEAKSVKTSKSYSNSVALQTGDVSQITPWLMLSVVSTTGIAGLDISKKKDKSKK